MSIISAAEYHAKTSYDRSAMRGHHLDWANQPSVFKEYRDLKGFELPRQVGLPQESLSQVLGKTPEKPTASSLDQENLAAILLLTYTLTARVRHPGGDFYYRGVPSAGALFPCELYAAVEEVAGIDPGLYHYAITDHALEQLRVGEFSSILEESLLPRHHGKMTPLVTFFITAIFFRSSWKYRERAYRYHLLDTGHLVENLALALRSLGLPFIVDADFHDETINALLGVDGKKEACLVAVRILGKGSESRVSDHRASLTTPSHLLDASTVSSREIEYSLLNDIQRSTAMTIKDPGVAPHMPTQLGLDVGAGIPITRPADSLELMNYSQAVWNRRSKRNFIPKSLPRALWSAFLEMLQLEKAASGGFETPYGGTIAVGFLAQNLEDLPAGFYLMDPLESIVNSVTSGAFHRKMARACLEQDWLTGAALHFLFLTNLTVLEETYGPRGYRYAMIQAGRLGQKVYLGATVLGLGCCGIGAFYDDEAAEIIGLNEQSRLLYLVAAGSVKK